MSSFRDVSAYMFRCPYARTTDCGISMMISLLTSSNGPDGESRSRSARLTTRKHFQVVEARTA
ncbi:hypothetical protein DBR36_13100 [Microbacterium sp. HMWF026]|nr:hypothetical protein DBR36_13100 [Microbacterium sp. HMWF026]